VGAHEGRPYIWRRSSMDAHEERVDQEGSSGAFLQRNCCYGQTKVTASRRANRYGLELLLRHSRLLFAVGVNPSAIVRRRGEPLGYTGRSPPARASVPSG
jgi:hypothetical protein